MRSAPKLAIRIGVAVALCAAFAYTQGGQRINQQFEHEMQDPVDDPPDAHRKGELVLGRLRYRSALDRRGWGYARWGIDANKGDRLFIGILQRLTRIDVQPVEHIVDIDSEDMFEIPFLVAISIGDWRLSPDQATRLRKYFDRGGFLFVDDFHNEREWANFMQGMRMIYPDAQATDLLDGDSIFNTVFNMKERIRVPGANVAHGDGVERGGVTPGWRAILDDRGRVRVAISFNQDVGDGWEFADDPNYPEKYSSEAIRLGTNYAVYAMTH
jgi:hypothetical protein